jgi:predicted Kef-type K+ transport protein
MDIQLTAAETAKWTADPDWKAGFLFALQSSVAAGVLVVRILDDSSQVLATYARIWTAQP